MATNAGANEGFRLLDELVCQAIPDPSLAGLGACSSVTSRGQNEGIQVAEELILNSGRQSPSDRNSDLDLLDGLSVVETLQRRFGLAERSAGQALLPARRALVTGPSWSDQEVNDATLRIGARTFAIMNAVVLSAGMQQETIEKVVKVFSAWMKKGELVRVIGAGRALLAGAIPANRLAHAGANVHHIHDLTPLPNTKKGGAILACSASGRTPDVLEIMRKARTLNKDITIVGFAGADAQEFRELCDYFVGIYIDQRILNPLTALADTGEYVISQLLDAMVVLAAERIGFRDGDWRTGHEDLGPTGPYSPPDK